MRRIFRVLAIILVSFICFVGIFFLIGRFYLLSHRKNTVMGHANTVDNEHGVVIAKGRKLYDENGNLLEIKGINFGNLFITEGWMTVNSIGALYNEDGSFKRVNEQGIVEEYEEIYQEELDAILENRVARGDYTQEQLNALREAYFYAYCTEADFKLIKDMGLNTIRLPMYYRNFMEGADDNLTMRDDAFEKLDYFLELAKKHGLKVIIDMHGVAGGQS